MSHRLVTPPAADFPALGLRPEAAEDEAFLFEVYASTREEELRKLPWDDATRSMFLRLQFKAMRQGYAGQFPKAAFSIITLEGRPVGRIVVDRSEDPVRLVDIALLPKYRTRGLGSRLMRDLLAEAGRNRKAVRLQVLKGSRAAAWYHRLGFVEIADDGVYTHLEWRDTTS